MPVSSLILLGMHGHFSNGTTPNKSFVTNNIISLIIFEGWLYNLTENKQTYLSTGCDKNNLDLLFQTKVAVHANCKTHKYFSALSILDNMAAHKLLF